MNQHPINDIIVQTRMTQRRRAAEQHRLVRSVQRARRRRTISDPTAAGASALRTGDLAVDLAALGFDAVEHEMARFIRRARTSGAAAELLAVLTDQRAPVVVRQRAFARIAATFDRPSSMEMSCAA